MAEQKVVKSAKKKFFPVEASMTSMPIGLYGSSAEEMNGKTIKLDLTRNLKGKNLELVLRIKLEDGKLIAYPEKVSLASSYVKRLTRKGADYVEDSFKCECKDAFAVIKFFLLTKARVSNGVLRILRENAKKFLEKYVKTRSASEMFLEITSVKLQRILSKELKRFYPLSVCEIRWFEVLKGKEIKKEESKEELKNENVN